MEYHYVPAAATTGLYHYSISWGRTKMEVLHTADNRMLPVIYQQIAMSLEQPVRNLDRIKQCVYTAKTIFSPCYDYCTSQFHTLNYFSIYQAKPSFTGWQWSFSPLFFSPSLSLTIFLAHSLLQPKCVKQAPLSSAGSQRPAFIPWRDGFSLALFPKWCLVNKPMGMPKMGGPGTLWLCV